MGDEKERYQYVESLPIPTYEEATSSRPASSQSHVGPEETSDDAERQGLLSSAGVSNQPATSRYEPPTVESARSSLDLLPSIDGDGSDNERDSTHQLRQEVEQMEIEEPDSDNGSHRSLLTNRFMKNFPSLSQRLSSIRFPQRIRQYLPSIRIPSFRRLRDSDTNSIVVVGRLFGVFLIVGVVYLLIASDILSFGRGRRVGQIYDPGSIRQFVQAHMNDRGGMQEALEYITSYPHMAGTEGNYVLGEWVMERFKKSNLEDVNMERFDVYLNYPTKDGRRVAIVDPPDLAWNADLEEDKPQTGVKDETYAFHGHSKSGDVTGPLIYANYGSRKDFETLKEQEIDVKGAIVLVKYYGTEGDRALKVKAAELAGAAGCIIYSDPAEDGRGVCDHDFPDCRGMPEDGVQRGAVSLMSWIVGDVLTPGWASTPENKKRLKPEETPGLVGIPSIPISWRNAEHLLSNLQGHGKQMSDDWHGWDSQLEWWSGDSSSPKVNLKNVQDEIVDRPIYNILGRISGWEQEEKKVIVGNHRDAWCLGAADPGSGTAIMLEVIRIFGELKRLGWQPLRTIEFASWDGEEYNLIGSTEHVENRMDELRLNGVAYLNVDVGVRGDDFRAAASPVYSTVMERVMGRVAGINMTADPDGDFIPNTLKDKWREQGRKLEGLGAGSDFVAFQDIVGTSSIDMFFHGVAYPYHSCYDNFAWMKRFGDPDWVYHKMMGEVWALMILELADRPILPFNMEAYATAITGYVEELEQYVNFDAPESGGENHIDLSKLREAAATFETEARTFHEWDGHWSQMVYGTGGFETNVMAIKRMAHNNRMSNFETHLLDLEDDGGLPGRQQFKHIIYAPQLWSGYDSAYFPGIRDAVNAQNWTLAREQTAKVARIFMHAALKLNGN